MGAGTQDARSGSEVELLERAGELSKLGELLTAVREGGRGRVVLVGGEAGVGKTALLRRFREEVGGSAAVLWGACDPLFTPRPLAPLLEIGETTEGELARAVGGQAVPHEIVAALAHELRREGATVLVFEDVHWADEATLDVLKLLARRVEEVPALVVASYRDDQLDRRHPLRIVLGELATSTAVARLPLAPLSPAAVAELAEPCAVDAGELFRKTAGNPFFVVEALASGSTQIPDTVRDAVLARVAQVDVQAQALLEAVSVVPQQVEYWLLEALAGDAIDRLEDCLGSGLLAGRSSGVTFRHELARLAVEESVALDRKVRLHRNALATLAEPPVGVPDTARLAHHAEAAGDAEAVLRFAPAAAASAEARGAHREAAAQYARALRFAEPRGPAERAELLERRAEACYITDQYDEGIAALERAVELRRLLDDRLREGDALRRLSNFLWCPGRTRESERSARDAIAVLESLPPSRELAAAYANLAALCLRDLRSEEALAWSERALRLAERFDDTGTVIGARAAAGVCRGDLAELDECLELAHRAGIPADGWLCSEFAGAAIEQRSYAVAAALVERGLSYCSERGIELSRLYLLADRARLELAHGRWTEATETAATILRVPRTSTTPRIRADVVLGLVRARRGDPGAGEPLAEAWELAAPTGELPRLGPAAAALAEAAWLARDPERVAEATEAALPLALERGWARLVGELADWRRRAGLDPGIPPDAPTGPYAAQLAGDSAGAAELWAKAGCPYESALALGEADDDEALRRALAELQRLDAGPAAAIVAARLRAHGVRALPRGPRRATRRNPANLTARELEVLELMATGLRNSEIATRLVLSTRTVDHHVSAILRKLAVRTRGQASREAARLGLAGEGP
ncbi:MAG: ATP-binding protein [Gaiellaceae bacterium]